MKHIYLKSYLRHIGVLAPIVLFFAWLWNVPQFLIVVTLVVVLMVVAEFKIEEMLYRYHPDVRFTMLGLVRVVGIILWCAMIALIVYYRPEAFGYLLAYAICMPCLAGIAELIKIMGETFVSQL